MDTVIPIVTRLNPNFSDLNKILLNGSNSCDEAVNKAILEATLAILDSHYDPLDSLEDTTRF